MPDPVLRAAKRSTILIILLLPILLGAPASPAQDGSLGVTPAEVRVPNAQEEQRYERQVTVQNVLDTPTVFNIALRGDVASWTTTDPAGTLEVPAQTNAVITLTFDVPKDAYLGTHPGFLTIAADPRDQPEGSGLATSWGVTVLLNVTVGGDPFEEILWSGAHAPDVEVGTPPMGSVTVANAGNIVSHVQARAEVLEHEGGQVLAETDAQAQVIPGRQKQLEFAFTDTLPEGQYRMRITAEDPSSFEAIEEFKVVPLGALGKEGILRFIEHDSWVAAGEPVRVTGVFENTGTNLIARASFTAEVYKDGRLTGVVTSEPRVVRPGDTVELDGFYTPKEAGRHTITGTVNYDGFETMKSESILNVEQANTKSGLLPLVAGLGAFLLIAAVVALYRRGRRERLERKKR